MPENYIGIMCGTSLDSLDFALCQFDKLNKVKLFKSYQLTKELKGRINLCKEKPNSKILFDKVDREVTDFILVTLKRFIACTKVKKIKAIGYPGITVLHKPEKKISKNLGNPELIAKNIKIKVIGDFRLTDMKVGGQGAPLAPYFHDYISSSKKSFLNILNLGGFANLSYKSDKKLIAYDTGPANYLIDMIAKTYFNRNYDKNGALARKGKMNEDALLAMLSDKYFCKKIPKSTGFEKFNIKWLKNFQTKFNLKNKDNLIATVTQLSIISISDAINSSHFDSSHIFFSGGGSRNNFVKKQILKRTGLNEIITLPWGLDYKNLESAAFAWLAMMRDKGKMISKAYVTGAKCKRKLGIIYR
tara:strand:- start:6573 stop:7649 length:1077 start_codon:yes stop_codon:yes gene_type:complete